MKKILTIILAFILAAPVTMRAEESGSEVTPSLGRPKIGLVLSGGGAKGAAHIGVLKVLEENNIPIDYIAGTSMGAIIGGLYAMGYKADDIDSLITHQDWPFVMSDNVKAENISFEDKRFASQYPVRIPFTIKLNSVAEAEKDIDSLLIGPARPPKLAPPRRNRSILDNVPMAYINGQNIYNLFSSLSIGYQDSIDFDKMPIPFACVAVDIHNKQEVVLRSGRIVEAIRASMAIPGYFAPVRMGDKVLYDGGLLNNYPVDVVRKMGADIVIGVKLGRADEVEEQTGENLAEALSMMLDLFTDTKLQGALDNTDILIRPSTKGFGALSFDPQSIETLLENGRAAALEQETSLKNLKRRLDKIQKEQAENLIGPVYKRKTYKKAKMLGKDTLAIGNVNFHGLTADQAQRLFKRSKLQPGAHLTGEELEAEIDRFYNTRAFKSVSYRLKGNEEPYDMEISFVSGHNCDLGLGARVDNEEAAVVMFDIGINRKVLYGSSVSLAGKLCYNPKIAVQYTYSFPAAAQYHFKYEFAFTNTSSLRRYDDYLSYLTHSFDVYASTKKFRNVYTEIGAQFRHYKIRDMQMVDPYEGAYEMSKRENFLSFYIKPEFNNLDDLYFPTKGFDVGGSFTFYTSWLNKKEYNYRPFSVAELHYRCAVGIGKRVALIPEINARVMLGNNPSFLCANYMGSYERGRFFDQQIPFRAFNHFRIMKPVLATGALGVNVNIFKKHYVTASGSFAMDGTNLKDFVTSHKYVGAQVGYALYSPVGPLALNVHWCNTPLPGKKPVGVYVSMGFSF